MAQNGPSLLREAREKAGFTREQLALRMECISVATLKRWEYGESRPDSTDVNRIGEIIGDKTLWHRWMIATDEAYAQRYGNAESLVLPVSIMRVRHSLGKVLAYQEAVERDALDGRMDDQQTAAAYGDCIRAAIAELSDAAQYMTGGEKHGH